MSMSSLRSRLLKKKKKKKESSCSKSETPPTQSSDLWGAWYWFCLLQSPHHHLFPHLMNVWNHRTEAVFFSATFFIFFPFDLWDFTSWTVHLLKPRYSPAPCSSSQAEFCTIFKIKYIKKSCISSQKDNEWEEGKKYKKKEAIRMKDCPLCQ